MVEKYEVVSGDTLWGLARPFFGDGSLYQVITVANRLTSPDYLVVGQGLEIPYVTYRYRVAAGDTKKALAQRFYNDVGMAGVIEVANDVGQRDLIVGEWLLIPDLADVGHHTVAHGETLEQLAERWYGETSLWPIISLANALGDEDPRPGQVLVQPRLNRRRTVVAGDTLRALTVQNYGDHDVANRVKLVAAANHIADPNHIGVGQVIFFPSLA